MLQDPRCHNTEDANAPHLDGAGLWEERRVFFGNVKLLTRAFNKNIFFFYYMTHGYVTFPTNQSQIHNVTVSEARLE